MTHDDAFLQAITENPEDDTPRLVYADWLTDRDDPRGDFIRVQCHLARMDDADPERPVLEASERRLLTRHQDEWLGPLRPLLSHWTFRRGFLDEAAVPARVYLAHTAIPWPATVRRVEVDLDGFEVPLEAIEFLPGSVARENVVLPIGWRDGRLVLALTDPQDTATLEKLEFILNRSIEPVTAQEGQIVQAISRHYAPAETDAVPTPLFFSDPPASGRFLEPESMFDLEGNNRPIVKVVNLILAEAVAVRATEIHLESNENQFRVRYRIDGEIVGRDSPPRRLLDHIVTRICIIAGMPIADEAEEQTGMMRLAFSGRQFELGVLIRRTPNGPAVVITLTHPGTDEPSRNDP